MPLASGRYLMRKQSNNIGIRGTHVTLSWVCIFYKHNSLTLIQMDMEIGMNQQEEKTS